jgi:hypothetical protein
MGRKHRRRTDDTGNVNGPAAYGARRVEDFGGEDWVVQTITGSASTKTYRCPGCDQEIRPATPHVVAYPADGLGGVESRRHWHSACWSSRNSRGPRTMRSSRGPRY